MGGVDSDKERERRWAELYVRAKMMLDDEGLAQEEKRKDVAAKKLRRAGLEAPPVDLQKVKATQLKYAECMKYSEAVKATGITKSDMACAGRGIRAQASRCGIRAQGADGEAGA